MLALGLTSSGNAFDQHEAFLFVIEPRRKIYDYDPRDFDPLPENGALATRPAIAPK